MKLIFGGIFVILGIGLCSITFDDISFGWNVFLTYLGAALVLIGIIIIGNKINKKSF